MTCLSLEKTISVQALSQNCQKRLLDLSCLSVCLSMCLSVRIEQLGSYRTDFHEIWYSSLYRKSVDKIQVSLNSDKNNGYFTWKPVWVFYIIFRWIFLGMRNVSDKSRREDQNTDFIFNIVIFRKSLRLWDNVEKRGNAGKTTCDNMIGCMSFECWIPKDIDTHCE